MKTIFVLITRHQGCVITRIEYAQLKTLVDNVLSHLDG